jgi:uncharacterized protein (DUF849 family)
MAASRKVIISCAVTGAIHTPTMSPHLPVTPDQIASSAIEAARAGASILHLHARNPENGRPTPEPAVFFQFLPRIKDACDAVINITTGGGLGMTVEQRLAAPMAAKPEMCSLNMGSMNFGLYPALEKFSAWKHDWEPRYLESTRDSIFGNTFKDIETIIRMLGDDCGMRFEFECYDIGHLFTLHHFVERKLVRPPLFVQSVFGILGGIGADVENLLHMRRIADKLFGSDYLWSVLAAGRFQTSFATTAATIGRHVRVGLEGNLYLGKGELARGNADQVKKMRGILEALSLEIASPDETRRMLALKGQHQVGF